jgi:drug/metabolite transporter (DMT)-like permease
MENQRGQTPLNSSGALVLGAFAVLYLVWGSSFVATKIMVTDLPPLLAAGLRFTTAGVLLALVAAALGARVPRDPREWRHALVMGLLMVVVSNGINNVAMQYVASNQSALLNATAAFWIALLGTVGAQGHALSTRTKVGLAIGFLGVALILWPRGGFSAANLGWQLAIIAGCIGWAGATLYHRLAKPATPALMFTAVQMLLGGLLMTGIGLAAGDAQEWHFSVRGHLALLYLTLFSSCLAYTAFAYLLPRTTPARLGTYAYVNPVVAAVVGWLLLGETLSGAQLAGSAVIVLGVALVTLPQRSATPEEPTG